MEMIFKLYNYLVVNSGNAWILIFENYNKGLTMIDAPSLGVYCVVSYCCKKLEVKLL